MREGYLKFFLRRRTLKSGGEMSQTNQTETCYHKTNPYFTTCCLTINYEYKLWVKWIHIWTPLSRPLIKGGGIGPSKNWVTWVGGGGVPKFLLERGDNPGMGVDVEIGGCHFFITLQFNSIQIYCMCLGKVKFLLLYFDSLVFWVTHARFSSKYL